MEYEHLARAGCHFIRDLRIALLPKQRQGVKHCGTTASPHIIIHIMQALSPPNIESELSYAYLHAVASKAGMACNAGSRHEDNNGIDAVDLRLNLTRDLHLKLTHPV